MILRNKIAEGREVYFKGSDRSYAFKGYEYYIIKEYYKISEL
ncbi:MAG: hypothetical protein ACOX3T_01090 [Bdellovibrionota bacterium]